jgi:WYL_2, Sm-like SH3 beta-barrel fold
MYSLVRVGVSGFGWNEPATLGHSTRVMQTLPKVQQFFFHVVSSNRSYTMLINAENIVKQMIYANKGKIFSVLFVKRDGSLRKMVCRTGVTKYLKHKVVSQTEPNMDKNVITVFDMKALEYRSFNVHNMRDMKMRGMPFVLED